MTSDEIRAIQRKIGTVPDGFWGPKSIAACQSHLRRLMPDPNPWPSTDQASLTKFYGRAGDESRLVSIELPYPLFYEGKPVRRTRVHERCAPSLLDIFLEIRELYGDRPEIMGAATDFSGIYNNRPMRNGSLPSLHARGAAIDLDADDNGNLVPWPVVADMPLEIMEVFARHGWISAGAFWGRDAMHFQAARP